MPLFLANNFFLPFINSQYTTIGKWCAYPLGRPWLYYNSSCRTQISLPPRCKAHNQTGLLLISSYAALTCHCSDCSSSIGSVPCAAAMYATAWTSFSFLSRHAESSRFNAWGGEERTDVSAMGIVSDPDWTLFESSCRDLGVLRRS